MPDVRVDIDSLIGGWRGALQAAQAALTSAGPRSRPERRRAPVPLAPALGRARRSRRRARRVRARSLRPATARAPARIGGRGAEAARPAGHRRGVHLQRRRHPRREHGAPPGRLARDLQPVHRPPDRAHRRHARGVQPAQRLPGARSTADRARRQCAPFSRAAGSACRRATTTIRPRATPCTGSPTARTRCSSGGSRSTGSGPSTARASTSSSCATRGCVARSSRGAPTRRHCSSAPT